MSLRFALPSKGEMEAPTLSFLGSAGLNVERPNPRQYFARIPAIPSVSVVFQRVADIPAKVAEGSADLGIVGYDNVAEYGLGEDLVLVEPALGYSGCELVLALPDTWVDVSSIADLADLASEFRSRGRDLRVATKYPRLVQDFLLRKRISHFTLVESKGAMEAAPTIGYADIIADLTASGTTLRENRLKLIDGGSILRSQACLIGNRKALLESADKRAATRSILELIEARMRAQSFVRVTANIRGASEQDVANQILLRPDLAGLTGPTVSRVFGKEAGGDDQWYAVALVVRTSLLLDAIAHLRAVGGAGLTVVPVAYVFEVESKSYARLVASLGLAEDA